MTLENIARIYNSALDSVSLLNASKPVGTSEEDWQEMIIANKEHLRRLLEKDYWTNEDLQPFIDAVNLDMDGVPDQLPPVESVISEPEPIPDWNGFYDGLIMSATYNHLLGLTAIAPNITGSITAIAVAIVQGQLDPSNPNRLAALQAAINAVLGVLVAINQPLTTEQLAEVRGLLDGNGFGSITLGS
jgi:hypothetical protein